MGRYTVWSLLKRSHLSVVVGLKEKPAMAFEIFRPVSPPGRTLFDHRENRRACALRAFEMSIEIVHVDEHPIDNPGHRGPLACLLAHLAMSFRTAVLRCRRGQHDQSVPCFHLAV